MYVIINDYDPDQGQFDQMGIWGLIIFLRGNFWKFFSSLEVHIVIVDALLMIFGKKWVRIVARIYHHGDGIRCGTYGLLLWCY